MDDRDENELRFCGPTINFDENKVITPLTKATFSTSSVVNSTQNGTSSVNYVKVKSTFAL